MLKGRVMEDPEGEINEVEYVVVSDRSGKCSCQWWVVFKYTKDRTMGFRETGEEELQ